VFLLTAYAKTVQDNLTDAQIKAMARIVATVVERYGS